MGRELDDPNDLVEQRRRRKLGSGTSQPASQLKSEQVSNLEKELAKEPTSQPSDNPAPQQSSVLESQQSSMVTNKQSGNLASQVTNHVDSSPSIIPANQQAKLPASEVSSNPDNQQIDMPASQQSSKLTSQKASSKKSKKDDREQQALYLPSEQRQILKMLAVLENRELSDIAEDAFNAYIERSPFKSVLPALIEAQRQGKDM